MREIETEKNAFSQARNGILAKLEMTLCVKMTGQRIAVKIGDEDDFREYEPMLVIIIGDIFKLEKVRTSPPIFTI